MPRAAEVVYRQGIRRAVALVSGALAGGLPTEDVDAVLDEQFAALQIPRDVFRRELAAMWLAAQAKALKPRKPRDTAARRRRALLAEIAAGRP